MDVIALVDDIEVRILTAQILRINGHAHSLWRDAIARKWPAIWPTPHVVAVRNTTNGSIVGRGSIGGRNGFARNTFRVETRQ